MKKVKVSHSRSWIGLVVTGTAVVFLTTIILAGREPSPLILTPIAQIEPSSTPTLEVEPTPNPRAPLPDAYLVTWSGESIVLYDPQEQVVLADFGSGQDFMVHEHTLIILHPHYIRAFDLLGGSLLWQTERPNLEYTVEEHLAAWMDQTHQLMIAEYVSYATFDVRLQFSYYALDNGQLQHQQNLQIDHLKQVAAPGGYSQQIVFYTQDSLELYDLERNESTQISLPISTTIAAVEAIPNTNTWYVMTADWNIYQLTVVDEQPQLTHITQYNLAGITKSQAKLIDMVVLDLNKLYFITGDEGQFAIHRFDIVSGEGRSLINKSGSMTPDKLGGGVWISNLGPGIFYWDGQSDMLTTIPIIKRKAISIPPHQPTHAVNTSPEFELANETEAITRTIDTSEPLFWFSIEKLSSTWPTYQVMVQYSDGLTSTISTDALMLYPRKHNLPLIQLTPNQFLFPETGQIITTNRDIPMSEYTPQAAQYYAFSPTGDHLAVVSPWIPRRTGGMLSSTLELLLIDLNSGEVEVHVLPEYFENRQREILGWSEMGIFLLQDQSMVQLFDLASHEFTDVTLLGSNSYGYRFNSSTSHLAFIRQSTVGIENLDSSKTKFILQNSSEHTHLIDYSPDEQYFVWLVEVEQQHVLYSLDFASDNIRVIYQGPKVQISNSDDGWFWRDDRTLILEVTTPNSSHVHEYLSLNIESGATETWFSNARLYATTERGYIAHTFLPNNQSVSLHIPFGQNNAAVILPWPNIDGRITPLRFSQ